MKAITIRGVDQTLSEKLKTAASNENKSVNQFIISLLKENLGMKKTRRFTKTHGDLDHLFGRWSEKEYKRINNRINEERKIDRELWDEQITD